MGLCAGRACRSQPGPRMHGEAMSNNVKCWLAGLCAWLVLAAGGFAAGADLLEVRFGPKGEETRVVFDIMGAPTYAVSGDDSGEGRLIIDFASLSVTQAARDYRAGKGHIARYGFAPADGGMRAILDFKKTAKIKDVFVLEPSPGVAKHRLVIDVQTANKADFLASLPARYPDLAAVIEEATAPPQAAEEILTERPSQREVALPPAERLTVVIDPGHGGADPGAQGQSGTLEKHVTLAAARELGEILESQGRYEVVLTRSGDVRLRPEEREELARKAGADLFISLHADAIAQSQIRGGSIYTLSEQGSERSAKLAKAEGNYQIYDLDAAQFGEVVGGILLDKAQDKTNTGSSRFAEMLIAELSGKTPLLNRTHRTGDLRVLLAPDVPAVLFEMAFISNAKDEANLNSAVWRTRAMTAVAEAINAYFDEQGGQRYAASRSAGAQ